MSDSAQLIMSLDLVPLADRQRAVDALAEWLLDAGAIAPFDRSNPDRTKLARSDWSPGPNWREVVDEVAGAEFETLLLNGVDATPDVKMQSSYANSAEWRCPACAADLESGELIEVWIESEHDPLATCGTCGWAARLGDWPNEFPPALVGAPTITFHNWHPLKPEFIAEINRRLGGGRCRYFWQRL